MLDEAPGADVVLMAAAVADYRPARAAREKLKRTGEPLTLVLEPNADILAQLGRARRPGQVLVGFALEMTRYVARARAKLGGKGLDLVVLNTAGAIGGETNRVTLVEARAERELPLLSKREVAEQILERVAELLGASSAAPLAKGAERVRAVKPAAAERAIAARANAKQPARKKRASPGRAATGART